MQNGQATVRRINVRPLPDGKAMSIDLPEHVQELYDKHHQDMVPEDQILYKELLWKYSQIFTKSKTDLGRTDLIKLLVVAFQALEMKPWVDVDLKGSSIAPDDGTTDPTCVSVEPTGMPVEPTGMAVEAPAAIMQHHITTVEPELPDVVDLVEKWKADGMSCDIETRDVSNDVADVTLERRRP